MDYERLFHILSELFRAGGNDHAHLRTRAVERAIRELEKFLDIEWTRGEITAICGKELT